jgi:copper chaperone CopZ
VVTKLLISGMSCNHCVRTVSDALRAVTGVTRVDVKLPDRAEVDHEAETSFEALASAVQSAGYEARHI